MPPAAAGARRPERTTWPRDKVVGTVTSAAWSPELGAWAALAYLHRSVHVAGPGAGEVGRRRGRGPAGAVCAPLPLVDLTPRPPG